MVSSKNLFYRITAENENAVTEVLCNLMKHRFIRDIVIRFFIPDVGESALDSLSEEGIIPQKRIEDGGQPDIQIISPQIYIIVENKIRKCTAPTSHELSSYITAIKSSKAEYKRLVYLIPQDYSSSPAFKDIEKENSDIVSVCNWEKFLEALERTEVSDLSQYFQDAIEYFSSLVDLHIIEDTQLKPMEVAMIYEPNIMLSAFSASEKLKKRFNIIAEKIIANITPMFTSDSDIKIYAESDQCNSSGIGQYIVLKHNNKKNEIFYGFSNLLDISKNDKYSFSVAFYFGNDLFDVTSFEDKERDQYWWYIPIEDRKLLISDNDEKLVNAIANIIYHAIREEYKNQLERP